MKSAKGYFEEKLKFEIDPWGVRQLIENGGRMCLIDVRDSDSYAKGHIPGAINAPIDALESSLSKIRIPKRGAAIIVYCYNIACFRATRAALELSRKGFANVVEMVGGFEEWAKHGYDVEKARSKG